MRIVGTQFEIKAERVFGTGIAAYPDVAQCRTTPYIFLLTDCWNFRQAAPALSALGVSPRGELRLTFFPQDNVTSQRIAYTICRNLPHENILGSQ